eukprot:Pgem_evm1s2660
MSSKRCGCAAITLLDNRVMVIGGFDSFNTLNTAEIYNPTNNTWTSVSSMSTSRQNCSAITVTDGRVIVVGG